MSFTFYNSVPNAPNNPANDQPLMLTNNQSTYSLINVDHVGFGTTYAGINNSGGFHTVIHLCAPSGSPATVGSGVGLLYSQTQTSINNSTALYWKTAGGQAIQLTMNATPNPFAAGSNITGQPIINRGWSFLPGGLIFNYGSVVFNTNPNYIAGGASSLRTVNYLQPYQVAAPYSLTFGYLVTGQTTGYSVWCDGTNSQTQFIWQSSIPYPQSSMQAGKINGVIWWAAIGQ
jgi:hypothetical protein